ncbi:MAG: Rieske (2Fe-2S) protein [Polyangiaceae bacterium]|nr:Rieske (2Fe-2S) protein [Polyangiaceae bacterium]
MPRFSPLGPIDAFPPGGHTAKIEKHQLAVLRTQHGDVHVVDNRCPHEGYPLAQGKLDGCVLTCAWHNWKFDVTDGHSVLGGEGVRVFPCRIREGILEVDLEEPDPKKLIAGYEQSLREGFFKRDNGRIFRDGLRLLQVGVSPRELLLQAIRYDAIHAEYGTTHVLPMAADACRQFEWFSGLDVMHPIAHVLDLCGESNVQMPPRSIPQPISTGTGEDVVRAIEAEDLERAEGIVRGAILSGVSRADIEDWLYDACGDHFLDFGHPLIYIVKAQEFFAELPNVDREVLADIYGAMVYSIGVGTREDTLPYMRSYFKRFDAIEAELRSAFDKPRHDAPFDAERFRKAALEGSVDEACEALFSALLAGVSPERVAVALVGAASERLFRFDLDVERSLTVAENWLWATHRFTFASAVRNGILRWRKPKSLRLLMQTLAFTHSGRKMDAPPERRPDTAAEMATIDEIAASLESKDGDRAVRRVVGYLSTNAPIADLRRAVFRYCTRDPFVRPIYVAHAVKVAAAAFEEYEANGDRTSLLGAVRFLASPVVRERRVDRSVAQSIRWVAEGITPKKLTQ